MCRENPPVDGVAVTGGEPLLQSEFVRDLLAASDIPHPRLLETNGTLPERLLSVLPWVDLVSMDIKLPSNSGQASLWETHAQFLRNAAGKLYVKIPVDGGTDPEEVRCAVAMTASSDPGATLFLQPITTPEGRTTIDLGRLEVFFVLARRHLKDVRVLPQLHKVLGVK